MGGTQVKSRLLITGLLVLSALVWMTDRPSEAVPAFSRKHGVSCSACHNPFPRLRGYPSVA